MKLILTTNNHGACGGSATKIISFEEGNVWRQYKGLSDYLDCRVCELVDLEKFPDDFCHTIKDKVHYLQDILITKYNWNKYELRTNWNWELE